MAKKVLYIEDEKSIGEIYKGLLNQAGFQTEWVPSVPAAEKIAATFQADLLLVDNGLQEGKNGIEAIPDLKKTFPQAKIVIYSNYVEQEKRDKAKELGADKYWTKSETMGNKVVEGIKKMLS